MTLGKIIAAARETHGLTQVELARELEVSPQFINDIEHDRRVPNRNMIAALSEELDIYSDVLWFSIGKIPPYMTAGDYSEKAIVAALAAMRNVLNSDIAPGRAQ